MTKFRKSPVPISILPLLQNLKFLVKMNLVHYSKVKKLLRIYQLLLPPPPPLPPENLPTIKTISENEIDKILDHTWYNGQVHYKLLFKNVNLPKRYFQGPWVPQSVIDRYFNDMKQDLPYKKFYPPKVRKV